MAKKTVLMFLVLNSAISCFLPNEVRASCSGNNSPQTNLERVNRVIVLEMKTALTQIKDCDPILAAEGYNRAARRVSSSGNRPQGQIFQYNISAINSLIELTNSSDANVKLAAQKALLQLATFDNAYKTSDPKTTDLIASMKIKLLPLTYFLEQIKAQHVVHIAGYTVQSKKEKGDRTIQGGNIDAAYITHLLDQISKNDGNIKVRQKIDELKKKISHPQEAIDIINALKNNAVADPN